MRETARRQRILHALRVTPGLSKVQLARHLHMSPATAGIAVEELQRAGMVVPQGLNHGTGGRPSERLALNDREPLLLAVHVSRGGIHLATLDLAGRIVRRRTAAYRWHGASPSPESVVEAVHGFLADAGPVAGIGLAAPGLVDCEAGVVRYAANFGWRDVPLRRMLAATTEVPVAMDHNTAAALIAEDWWGAARAVDPVAFVTLGLEIGMSMRIEGTIVRGVGGGAGELGHIPMVADGPLCGCGRRGCLEALSSSVALRRRYRELRGEPAPPGDEGARTTPPIADIEAAARAGDGAAQRVLAEIAGHLGTGLATLVNLLNPQLVVLGGELMEARASILPTIRDIVSRRALPELAAQVELRHSTFGDEAPLIGAGTMAQDALFRSFD